MRNGHKIIVQAKVEMPLVKAIPVIARVIPRAIDLAPLAINLHGVPGMAVTGIAGLLILDACSRKKLGIGLLIRLARTRPSAKRTLGAAPRQGIVIFQLLKQPVMEPKSLLVLGAIGLGIALRNGLGNTIRD